MTFRHQRGQSSGQHLRWQAVVSALAVLALMLGVPIIGPVGGPASPVAHADQTTVTFEGFTLGSPDGQQGWSKTGAYDHLITDAATTPSLANFPSLGSKALRISNAVASGSFGDQTISASLANEAGETAAQNGGLSGGVRSAYFEAEWDIASADPNAEQTGMAMSMSPDRGDGARMSYMGIADGPGGLTFTFYDFTGGDFQPTVVATNQPRNAVYNIKLQMIFVDGQVPNDIVRVYLNGSLVHTGTSWERYFIEVVAENPPSGNPPRTVDSLILLTRGTSVPANAGKGFFIDNIKLTSGLTSVFVRTDGNDATCDGAADAATTGSGVCAVQTIARGAQLAAALGATVNVGPGAYGEAAITLPAKNTFTLKGTQAANRPTITNGVVLGGGSTVTLQDLNLNGLNTAQSGITSTLAVSGLTVKNVTIQNYVNDGVFMSGPVNLSDILFENVESNANGRHGFYITPNAGQTVSNFTLRQVTANGNNPAPAASQSGRGAWFINGTKSDITIENSTFNNNRLVGLDLSEGNVASAVITGNTVTGNGDSGIGILGPKTAMNVSGNTVTDNGRFGIEIKNPDGPTSGASPLVVSGNTVSRTVTATDVRDHAGILVMRRGPQAPANVDQPAGVLIQNNVVSGFRANAPGTTGDGFCIVVEGTNITVQNNIVSTCDVGIQVQKGNTANVQSTPFFDRGDAASFSGVVQANSIASTNTFGLRGAGLTSAVDGTGNWWGSSSGPSHTSNLSPNGAPVSDNITFSPFLTRGTDTSASIGFQPDTAAITNSFVRTDGSNTECDGSTNAAFSGGALGACAVATVQKGVDVAQAGSTVNVGAGTYFGADGSVNTPKSVTIQGASRATTILDGFVSSVKTNTHGIQFTAGVSGAAVKNLTVRRYNLHGIFAGSFSGPGVGTANFTVDNVESSDNGDVGQAPGTGPGSARGIVVWDGAKTNITITNSIANNNSLVGIDLQDGTVANAIVTGNTVSGNRDAGIGVQGPKTAMNVSNNTVTNNGRFGIEIKNPDGPTSGVSTLVVDGNTVSRSVAATDVRDHAGIVVMRRDPVVSVNVDQPAGVIVQNNVVSGFRANAPATTGEGFGIVVEGANITVRNNSVTDSDVGIQMQKGNTANTQSTTFFDRGNAADFTGLVELNNAATSNTVGIRGVGLTASTNATRNWWGNATGPTTTSNPTGTGSSVVGANVAFSPWLGDGTDTSGSIGFQPNVSPLVALNTQGINVSPTTGLTTTENGGAAQFSIVLASQPTGNVSIGLSSSNTSEGTVSPNSLTFTPANWNVPQVATVTGVSSGAPNGNVAYTIITAPADSTDPLFDNVDPLDVAVTNNAATSPTISIADATVAEGNGAPVQLTFNVTLSAAHTRTVTVNYATASGTATSNTDFISATGTLTFAVGETVKTVSVPVLGDQDTEPDETLTVTLSNPVEASIARGQATGAITNDDLAPVAVACGPRPNVQVTTQSVGGRRMQVTVRAENTAPNTGNQLAFIQFGTPTNATVQMIGQSTIGTSQIALPAATTQLVFVVQQTNANASFHVPFSVIDNCGPVEKFVGGGKDALAN